MRTKSRKIHNIHLRFDMNDSDERRICEAIRNSKNQTQYIAMCVRYFLENPPQNTVAEQLKEHARRIEVLESRRISEPGWTTGTPYEQTNNVREEEVGEDALNFLSAIPGCG